MAIRWSETHIVFLLACIEYGKDEEDVQGHVEQEFRDRFGLTPPRNAIDRISRRRLYVKPKDLYKSGVAVVKDARAQKLINPALEILESLSTKSTGKRNETRRFTPRVACPERNSRYRLRSTPFVGNDVVVDDTRRDRAAAASETPPASIVDRSQSMSADSNSLQHNINESEDIDLSTDIPISTPSSRIIKIRVPQYHRDRILKTPAMLSTGSMSSTSGNCLDERMAQLLSSEYRLSLPGPREFDVPITQASGTIRQLWTAIGDGIRTFSNDLHDIYREIYGHTDLQMLLYVTRNLRYTIAMTIVQEVFKTDTVL